MQARVRRLKKNEKEGQPDAAICPIIPWLVALHVIACTYSRGLFFSLLFFGPLTSLPPFGSGSILPSRIWTNTTQASGETKAFF
jgi:hypothetical protein